MTSATDGPWPPPADEVRRRVAAAWESLDNPVQGLPEDALARADETGWTIRDYLAHLSAWERSLIGLLEGRSRVAAMGLDDTGDDHDTDALNAQVLERGRRQSAAETLTEFAETHRRLTTLLLGLSDEDLLRPYSHYQPDDPTPNDQPVVGWIIGNTLGHYEEHRPAIERLAQTRS
jgi:hypothetical protein